MKSLMKQSPGTLWFVALNAGLFLLVETRLPPVTTGAGVPWVLVALGSLASRIGLLVLNGLASTALVWTEPGTRQRRVAQTVLNVGLAVNAAAWAVRVGFAP